jgi:mRNA interferase MazF
MGLVAPLISRGGVHYVRLDPTHGSELRKTRPCVVISPDELNHHLRTVIVAPMTTSPRVYPWRVPCRFRGRKGLVALDQIRTVDAERLGKKLGELSAETMRKALSVLAEMFSV